MKNIIVVTITLLSLFACKSQVKQQQEIATANNILEISEKQKQAIRLSVDSISKQNIAGTIKATGKVDVPPQNQISISTAFGGYVKFTKLIPGMFFKKGEVIAILEDNQYIQLQQDYLVTKANLKAAEDEYLRQKDLNATKASSDKNMEQALAVYTSQKVNLKALEEKLKLININTAQLSDKNISRNINIYAPFDGVVSTVNVNIGKYVAPSDVLFELLNLGDLHLKVKVFEKDLPNLYTGQTLYAFANGNPTKKYKCEVILVGKYIDDDGTTEVHAHFTDSDKNLLPGMYMNVEIKDAEQKSWSVKNEAILNFEGKNYVVVMLSDRKFELTEVTPGDSKNGYTEIKNSDVLIGKNLIVDGAYQLLMVLKNTEEEE